MVSWAGLRIQKRRSGGRCCIKLSIRRGRRSCRTMLSDAAP
ncbi:hypothetical protein [Thalassococcus sp.]